MDDYYYILQALDMSTLRLLTADDYTRLHIHDTVVVPGFAVKPNAQGSRLLQFPDLLELWHILGNTDTKSMTLAWDTGYMEAKAPDFSKEVSTFLDGVYYGLFYGISQQQGIWRYPQFPA